ncbi:MAG: GTP cyclohydrolase I FolE [Parachlamydiales bacterium]|nr:GTP cyclohydrolase I FolE [Parachlamydiales bacterium]
MPPSKKKSRAKEDSVITRYPTPFKENNLSDEKKIALIQKHFKEILTVLGLDLKDDSLANTPQRIAEMYVNEIFSGLNPKNFPDITLIEDKFTGDTSRVVTVKDIKLTSFCEHHFVPMEGIVTIAYIPNGQLIGLSKINRIVKFFASRPQVQERLTVQIADCLRQVLDTEHIAVFINAKHHCVSARGVNDDSSTTSTTSLAGDFQHNPVIRNEFFASL